MRKTVKKQNSISLFLKLKLKQMKKKFLFLLVLFITNSAYSQTASDYFEKGNIKYDLEDTTEQLMILQW